MKTIKEEIIDLLGKYVELDINLLFRSGGYLGDIIETCESGVIIDIRHSEEAIRSALKNYLDSLWIQESYYNLKEGKQ
jgi:hypothetical protein